MLTTLSPPSRAEPRCDAVKMLRARHRTGLVICSLLLPAGGAVAAATDAASAAANSTVAAGATSALSVPGRGANVPFTGYEAEEAVTNATVVGPDRTPGTLASEASGRRAVTLSGPGRYVEFTLTRPA